MTGKFLMYCQVELPLIHGVLFLGSALVNIPRMAAAPWQLQVRVVVLPLLLLVAYCLDVPGALVICTVVKLLAAWVGCRTSASLGFNRSPHYLHAGSVRRCYACVSARFT